MSLFYCIPWCRFLDPGEQVYAQGLTQSKVFNGPGCVCVGPCYPGTRRKAITLSKTDYIIIRDRLSSEERVVKGPQLIYLGPYEQLTGNVRTGESLGPTDFIKVVDKQTGQLSIVKGPILWFPESAFVQIVQKYTAVALKRNEFCKIVDTQTGKIRVVKGEALVYLSETEEFLHGATAAVNVDEHTAVLVRNTENGQLRLVTENSLFVPRANETIEKIQTKMVLEDHQALILKDKEGKYLFKGGRGQKAKEDRAFFIPPYCEVITLTWYQSPDINNKQGKDEEKVTVFDLRPQFLTYKFVCRTCDNVELMIDLTFFWELENVEQMVHKTQDLPGDICDHARSVIIQDVATVTLEKFMTEFNKIIHKSVLERNDPFYTDRGAKVHSVEVRSIHCKDPNTEKVLQEIIKETTDRINRLQKQTSENEVRLYKMKGEIETEKMKGDLLRIRHDHHRAEAIMEGEAQADHIKAFFAGLGGQSVPFNVQMDMWEGLKRVESISKIANTGSQMYFTSNDINLSVENIKNKQLALPASTKSGKAQ
eukprot:TRINITY_DN1299_c0_g1_i1.p1 TRINITY_DN1299_c0_g1~~TRINITY_DN1299_c0_g1_i1.p1  ORF type:complete len:537 (-),score=189.64 TRINITY_DN1299_c0_g1_i1:43-1653(-)